MFADDTTAVVRPLIYKLTGGRDLTGLLQAADTDFRRTVETTCQGGPANLKKLRAKHDDLVKQRQ